jgi:hypothetical protein
MNLTKHPRLLARVGGVFYLAIIVSAMWSYRYVRGELIMPGHMDQTMINMVLHGQLYRLGISAAVVTVLCNPPMEAVLYELLKLTSPRVALLALIFIVISTAIEAVNIANYMSPLFTVTLPEYRAAFSPAELQALVRGANRLWGYEFSVSLAFFGVACVLNGYLILRSKFLPPILGALMIFGGVYNLTDAFITFLGLPDIPYIGLLHPTLIIESALALWLVAFGVNEARWREQAEALRASMKTP